MFQKGDTVRYRRRLFVVDRVLPDGRLVLRDDEGETLTVRASQVSS